MIWLIEILRVYLEEHFSVRYYVIKDLILINVELLQWLSNILIKSLEALVLQVMLLFKTNN